MTEAKTDTVTEVLRAYIDDHEIAGAAVRIHRASEVIIDATLGFADIESHRPVSASSIFRLASLTKPIIAVAVMQLAERSELDIDDPIARFLPAFAATTVATVGATPSSSASGDSGNGDAPAHIVPAERQITIRDLLTHSSGLGQGFYSLPLIEAALGLDQPMSDRVNAYAAVPGDFQPGAETGYSPLVGFDILGHLVETISGTDLEAYLRTNIFDPLAMPDTTYVLNEEQQSRPVKLYEYSDNALHDVSLTEPMLASVDSSTGQFSGAAGLFSTLDDYDRFTQMLAGGGEVDGVRILQAASVARLIEERSSGARALSPGVEWGLGVIVEMKGTQHRARGSWGWSGAFGGHLVIDPINQLTMVLMINRSNIGGADSEVSRRVEHETLRAWGSVTP